MQHATSTQPSAPHLVEPRSITDFTDFIDSMSGEVKGFVSAERDYITLLLAKRSADASRAVVGWMVVALLCTVTLVLASIAGAIAIGQYMNDPAMGYLIMSGIWAVMIVVFFALWRGPLGDKFRLSIINLLHDN